MSETPAEIRAEIKRSRDKVKEVRTKLAAEQDADQRAYYRKVLVMWADYIERQKRKLGI